MYIGFSATEISQIPRIFFYFVSYRLQPPPKKVCFVLQIFVSNGPLGKIVFSSSQGTFRSESFRCSSNKRQTLQKTFSETTLPFLFYLTKGSALGLFLFPLHSPCSVKRFIIPRTSAVDVLFEVWSRNCGVEHTNQGIPRGLKGGDFSVGLNTMQFCSISKFA